MKKRHHDDQREDGRKEGDGARGEDMRKREGRNQGRIKDKVK